MRFQPFQRRNLDPTFLFFKGTGLTASLGIAQVICDRPPVAWMDRRGVGFKYPPGSRVSPKRKTKKVFHPSPSIFSGYEKCLVSGREFPHKNDRRNQQKKHISHIQIVGIHGLETSKTTLLFLGAYCWYLKYGEKTSWGWYLKSHCLQDLGTIPSGWEWDFWTINSTNPNLRHYIL